MSKKKQSSGPRVLLLDIETAPVLAHVWSLWDNNVALNQIVKDSEILSIALKWKGEDEIAYFDRRNDPDDKKLLQIIWKYIDEADVLVGHNIRRFDRKKLNAGFVKTKVGGKRMQPPSSYKQIDTLEIAKKLFGFTSNKLEYLASFLGVEHLKETHKKFPGHYLWAEVLKNNPEAWEEMEKYNKQDVLALEDVYDVLVSWDDTINFNLYSDDLTNTCKCGCIEFKRNGYYYTNMGKFQRYKCKDCGSESRDRKNLLSKEKKDSLRVNTVK
jgi:hypothetical protein